LPNPALSGNRISTRAGFGDLTEWSTGLPLLPELEDPALLAVIIQETVSRIQV
jgi:hypothetical protein